MKPAGKQVETHIRWMIRRDMADVFEIEGLSYENGWGEKDFLRCLQQRNCIGMVAEELTPTSRSGKPAKVLGFMLYELHRTRMHILNFAVHPGYRRLSVGRQMVAKLVKKLSSHGRPRIAVDVRETNLRAQLFFRSQEFRAIRVLRGFFETPARTPSGWSTGSTLPTPISTSRPRR